jgi:hypothetical protein
MADDAAFEPRAPAKKKGRMAVDESLILAEPRKRRRREGSQEVRPLSSTLEVQRRQSEVWKERMLVGEVRGLEEKNAVVFLPSSSSYSSSLSLTVYQPLRRRALTIHAFIVSHQISLPSTRHGGRSGSPNPATVRARTAEEYQEVQKRGMQLYEKMMAQTDPHECVFFPFPRFTPSPCRFPLRKLTVLGDDISRSRPLWHIFGELPDAAVFTDYYDLIKKPISFYEVRSRLDNRSSLSPCPLYSLPCD